MCHRIFPTNTHGEGLEDLIIILGKVLDINFSLRELDLRRQSEKLCRIHLLQSSRRHGLFRSSLGEVYWSRNVWWGQFGFAHFFVVL